MPSLAGFLVLAFLTLQPSPASSSQTPPGTPTGVLAADTPRTTVEGNKFVGPAGWRIAVRGPATILEPPEGNSHIALVDVHAQDADSAVAAAWAASDADVAAQAKSFFEQLAADRKLLTVPAADAGNLAPHYANEPLGDITVRRAGPATIFDFGEWKSEVASCHNPDGTTSFITIAPGIIGFEFVVGPGPNPTLIVRDAQHEYVFAAAVATK